MFMKTRKIDRTSLIKLRIWLIREKQMKGRENKIK